MKTAEKLYTIIPIIGLNVSFCVKISIILNNKIITEVENFSQNALSCFQSIHWKRVSASHIFYSDILSASNLVPGYFFEK